jgi:hypothetical protein
VLSANEGAGAGSKPARARMAFLADIGSNGTLGTVFRLAPWKFIGKFGTIGVVGSKSVRNVSRETIR